MSNSVLNAIKIVHYPDFALQCLQIGRLEVKITYMPRGIIIFENTITNYIVVLKKIITSLLFGNSIIIICNRNSHYPFVQFCDLISCCEIPPGVINMLLGENIVCPNNNMLEVKEIRGTIAYFTREKKIIFPLE